ncbi:potassium channel family protein [Thioalkalicoccus limnaeus]|uniref:Potassium channel family protein n=1 Tax=Thioalkalicoccus limnaeus TaxID=120681 RepID=A0ABV4BHE7_9GAMM
MILIVLSSLIAILETEAAIRDSAPQFFMGAQILIALLFTLEYGVRVYAAGEDPRFRGLSGRVRYMFTWWALVDLLAIVPFYVTGGAQNAFLIRLLRFLRLVRLLRLGALSSAWVFLADAVHARRFELALSAAAAGFLLIFSSACLYLFEARHQPEAFGSIPRALWWSVATLTTVGYGDVTPITPLGKLFASVTALAGIGLIAMPTGILAAAFSDALRRQADCTRETETPNTAGD